MIARLAGRAATGRYLPRQVTSDTSQVILLIHLLQPRITTMAAQQRWSTIVGVLFLCCLVNIALTFWQGAWLHQMHATTIQTPFGERPLLSSDLRLGRLACGPSSSSNVSGMVYWQDIVQDQRPKPDTQHFLTFEPDGGGWNNIRMALETVIAIAVATQRTLVLPPKHKLYLLRKDDQVNEFSLGDFFPLDEVPGLRVISMEDYLEHHAFTDRTTGQAVKPPRTQWDGSNSDIDTILYPWLRNVSYIPTDWNPDRCMVAFTNDTQALQSILDTIRTEGIPDPPTLVNRPTKVYASVHDRLREVIRDRQLCFYTQHDEPYLHLTGKKENRLLVHFYAFLFFSDWKADLWTKRLVRDRLRYKDEIQCAAGRIVQAVQQRSQERSGQAVFDAFHVRRGEFQYKKTRVSGRDLYEISQHELTPGATVYVATDEKNRTFFAELAQHYDVVYLDDFLDLVPGLNKNYYGMLDQLVASRARTFFGCWFSTFTGYINRLRGYHADRLKAPRFQIGAIDSYYYVPKENKNRMREYWPLSGAFYAREFPIAWRNIDQGIGSEWSFA